MYDAKLHSFCTYFYVTEMAIDILVPIGEHDRRIRIEALKDCRTGRYTTRAYLEEAVTLQPTFPQTNGSFDRSPEEFSVWVNYELPWTDRDTAEQAIKQSLGFLADRVST